MEKKLTFKGIVTDLEVIPKLSADDKTIGNGRALVTEQVTAIDFTISTDESIFSVMRLVENGHIKITIEVDDDALHAPR